MSDKTILTQDQQDQQDPQGELKDASQQQQGATDTVTHEQEPAGQQDDAKGGNKEAAKYRRQLRETETERDGLASTVETLRRQLVAGNMPTDRIRPEALWATGHTAGEFFDESGQLDAAKLSDITKATAETLGVPLQDVIRESGTGRGSGTPTATWADALRNRA